MSYQHFSSKERHTLMYLLQLRLSYREIGRRLGRHHTTIAREVRRNGRPIACYWDEYADQQAQARCHKPRHQRKRSNQRLLTYVDQRLQVKVAHSICICCADIESAANSCATGGGAARFLIASVSMSAPWA